MESEDRGNQLPRAGDPECPRAARVCGTGYFGNRHNSILWSTKEYMRLEGPGVEVSWGMLTREELGLL